MLSVAPAQDILLLTQPETLVHIAKKTRTTRASLDALKLVLRKACESVHKIVCDHPLHAGSTSTTSNASGDVVNALDSLAEGAIEAALSTCPTVAGYISEERHEYVPCHPDGQFIVVFDPLDGSQNIGVGLSVGTIFGVFEANSLAGVHAGEDMVAAAYCVHGAALQMVYAQRSLPVRLEQYHAAQDTWSTASESLEMPETGKIYCINEGNAKQWDEITRRFVSSMKGRSVRWMSCMVTDVHRPLLEGGCFLYPKDKKYRQGRLRLVYEAYPMAFIWEACGGIALAGPGERILSQRFPHGDLHARSGVVMLGKAEARIYQAVVAEVRLEEAIMADSTCYT